MSQDRTHGFDAVVEFNERVANDLLPEEILPPVRLAPIDVNIGGYRLTGEPEIFFPRDPAADVLAFNTTVPDGISLTIPFSAGNMTATGTDGVPHDAAINGAVGIVHSVTAYTDDAGQRCLGMDFSTLSASHVQVDITDMTLPFPRGAAETILAALVHAYLRDTVQRFSVYAVDVPENGEPYLPDDFDARVINDDCAALLISTTPDTTGDRNAFTHSDIPAGADTTVMISSRTLLLHVAAPEILGYLDLDGEPSEYFDYAGGVLQLRSPVSVSHLVDNILVDSITLTSMRLAAGEGRIDCDAAMSVRGFGYEASATLGGHLDFEMSEDGALTFTYRAGIADVDLRVYPWVWILIALGIALVPTIGGLIGLILPVLPAIIDPIADRIARRIGVGGVESIPLDLPVEIDSVVLDDLQFSGRAVTPARAPTRGPDLWLTGEAVVTGTESGGGWSREIIPGVTETGLVIKKAHRVRYRADSERMMFPIAYQWDLDGVSISGEGVIDAGDASVRYQASGRRCELFPDSGESLTARLGVIATAANGVALDAAVDLELEGSTEMRGFHGVELLEGPSLLQVLGALSADPELAVRPFPEEAIVQSRSTVISQNRSALLAGMGFDFPPAAFS